MGASASRRRAAANGPYRPSAELGTAGSSTEQKPSEKVVDALPLRSYQLRIIAEAISCNAIVVLPSGSGKTRVAAEVIKNALRSTPDQKALFLVPTCLLVNQQTKALTEESGISAAAFMGGKAVPDNSYSVMVSTPAAFTRLSTSYPLKYGIKLFRVVVFDEVHHVAKAHPYRKIAQMVQCLHVAQRPQIVGLTTSLTYEVDAYGIQRAVKELCAELDFQKLLTCSEEELAQGGFVSSAAATANTIIATKDEDATFNTPSNGDDDSRSIYSEAAVEFEIDEATHQAPGSAGATSLAQIPGRPHTSIQDFFHAVETYNLVLHPLIHPFVRAYKRLECIIAEQDPGFQSPIGILSLADWGSYAAKRARITKDPVRMYYNTVEHFYEALRTIISSRQSALELAMRYLEMAGIFDNNIYMPVAVTSVTAAGSASSVEGASSASGSGLSGSVGSGPANAIGVGGGSGGGGPTSSLFDNHMRSYIGLKRKRRASPDDIEEIDILRSLWIRHAPEFPRIARLKETLLEQVQRRGNDLRCLIFTQQRLTTHILQYCIGTDESLKTVRTGVIYAASAAAAASFSISPSMVKDSLQMFGSGQITVLIATSVAEEGMEIPKANCVIRFDSMQTPMSLAQSRGRASHNDSEFVVLAESAEKSVNSLMRAEANQKGLLSSQTFSFAIARAAEERRREAAALRKGAALQYLQRANGKDAIVLHEYNQKAGGSLRSNYSEMENNCWICSLVLSVPGDQPIYASSAVPHRAKRDAYNEASTKLLELLRKMYRLWHAV